MKTTVKFSDFCEAFNRADRADNFTRDGLRILFDHFEWLEQETGEEIELDVIALCCDYCEATTAEVSEMYGVTEDAREYLHQATIVCGEHTNENGETVFVFSAF